MKQITFETDFNNKLGCENFVHIALAPPRPVSEGELVEPIQVTVADNKNFKSTVRIVDLLRLPLSNLLNIHTLPSHGKYCNVFIEDFLTKNPNATLETPMAVYYYQIVR